MAVLYHYLIIYQLRTMGVLSSCPQLRHILCVARIGSGGRMNEPWCSSRSLKALQSVRRYAEARQSGAPERDPGIVGHD